MHVEIESRGSFGPGGKNILQRLTKKTLEEYFRHFEGEKPSIKLMAFAAAPGGDNQKLIKVVPPHPDFGRSPVGVPVVIYTEGTQGLTSLLQIEGKSEEEVRTILNNGPYNRRKRHAADQAVEQDEASRTIALPADLSQDVSPEASPPPAPAPAPVSDAPAVAVVQPVSSPSGSERRISPYDKLVAAGLSEDEIERLRSTLSTVILREVGDDEIPIQLQVSVAKITRAIMEDMKLSPNEAGNYRGIIGNFYSTRIAMFAFKLEDSTDPNATYMDWIFDCELVLDFVGGKNQLKALARVREAEIAERAVEASKPKAPAPTAEEVKEVVLDGFLADAEVLKLASEMLSGKREAEQKLEQAKANERGAEEEVARVTELLRNAQISLHQATTLREQAEAGVAKFTLSEDIREKVLQAKARLDALLKDLGV